MPITNEERLTANMDYIKSDITSKLYKCFLNGSFEEIDNKTLNKKFKIVNQTIENEILKDIEFIKELMTDKDFGSLKEMYLKSLEINYTDKTGEIDNLFFIFQINIYGINFKKLGGKDKFFNIMNENLINGKVNKEHLSEILLDTFSKMINSKSFVYAQTQEFKLIIKDIESISILDLLFKL